MPSVTVELPSLLAQAVGVGRRVAVDAGSLRGALDALIERHPGLAVHLFDESGDLREHVLCFHNDVNTRWMESMDVPVEAGDRIAILQAVSGG
jgi:sulfur-carrier protein